MRGGQCGPKSETREQCLSFVDKVGNYTAFAFLVQVRVHTFRCPGHLGFTALGSCWMELVCVSLGPFHIDCKHSWMLVNKRTYLKGDYKGKPID